MHDDIYNVKQPDNFYEPVLYESLRQIRVNYVMFKVISFTDFGPYLMFCHSLERCIR